MVSAFGTRNQSPLKAFYQSPLLVRQDVSSEPTCVDIGWHSSSDAVYHGMTGLLMLSRMAQVASIDSLDATPSDNTFTVTVGGGSEGVSGDISPAYTAGVLVAALNASSDTDISAITWSADELGNIYGQADMPGIAISATLSVSGIGSGSVTDFDTDPTKCFGDYDAGTSVLTLSQYEDGTGITTTQTYISTWNPESIELIFDQGSVPDGNAWLTFENSTGLEFCPDGINIADIKYTFNRDFNGSSSTTTNQTCCSATISTARPFVAVSGGPKWPAPDHSDPLYDNWSIDDVYVYAKDAYGNIVWSADFNGACYCGTLGVNAGFQTTDSYGYSVIMYPVYGVIIPSIILDESIGGYLKSQGVYDFYMRVRYA